MKKLVGLFLLLGSPAFAYTPAPSAVSPIVINSNMVWSCPTCATSSGSTPINLGTSASLTDPRISGDSTSGFYTGGASTIDVSVGGSKITEWTSSGQSITGILTVSGSMTAPLLIGGTTSSSKLTLESTSGAGTTDAIIFNTASQSEKMRLQSGGGLGIGTTTNGTNALLAVNGAGVFGIFGGNASATIANDLVTSGRVGIGTAAPTVGLSIVTATSAPSKNPATGVIEIKNSAAAGTAFMKFDLLNGTTFGGYIQCSNSGGGLPCHLQPLASAGTQGISIGSTAAPANYLDVNGNLGVGYYGTAAPTNGAIISGNVGIGTNNPGANLLGLGTTIQAKIDSSGNITGNTLTSTITTGTPPLAVSSTTQVANLNAATAGTAGTAGAATNATNIGITDDNSTNATMFPTWVTANTGNLPAKTSSTLLTWNPSTATETITGLLAVIGAAASTPITVTGVTNGTGLSLNTVTTGTGISMTGLTNGTGINITGTNTPVGYQYNATSASSTTASALTVNGSANMTADYTGAYISVAPTKSMTAAATRAFSGNMLSVNPTYSITGSSASVYNMTGPTAVISRTISNSSSSGSSALSISGALLSLTNTKGTATNAVTDTAKLLVITQSNATASGTVLDVENSGTGINAMFNGGDVEIGSSTPTSLLQIGGTTTTAPSPMLTIGSAVSGGLINSLSLVNTAGGANNNESAISFHEASNFSATAQISGLMTNGGTAATDLVFRTYNGSLTERMRISSAGAVTMPSLASSSAAQTGTVCWTTGTGNLTVDTTTTCLLSSMRFKKNVRPIRDALSQVMRMKPITFVYKDKAMGLDRLSGLIAEDVATINKTLVEFDPKGNPYKVRYEGVSTLNTKAIQEQQEEIIALHYDNVRLHKDIDRLRHDLNGVRHAN